MNRTVPKRIAVIGAGPMGIEAALHAAEAGHNVTVWERDRVGAHLLRWGHVGFFTPVRDNVSDLLWEHLPSKPSPEAYLTGKEFVDQILRPAAMSPLLAGRIREGTQVRSVGRRRLGKKDLPGHPLRAERPFQLLVHSKAGGEEIVEADVVLDASGVYATPNWSGESGIPCPGEREASLEIFRHLPDLPGKDRAAWIGQEILLIGSGHSAATAAVWLSDLTKEKSSIRVHWILKTDRTRPCDETPNDPLPERSRIVQAANRLAEQPPPRWRLYRKTGLLDVKATEASQFQIMIGRGEKTERLAVDKILSLTGYRADLSLLEELQISISPVTGAAEALAGALLGIKDCLAPVHVKPSHLESGEKGFYLIGHKSYGRLNTFLLRTGLQQIRLILDQIA